jgi:hypothetical protein
MPPSTPNGGDVVGRRTARRHALLAFVISRLPVALVAILVGQVAHGAKNPPGDLNAPYLAHPFGSGPLSGIADGIFSPLMRWDSIFYLSIAHSGYGVGEPFTKAFFPAYPLTIRLFGGLQSSPAVLLVSSYFVALAAFLASLYILHRLVELELGARFAWPAVLLFSLFPGSVFFSAPLSESLFLLFSLGSFYAARQGRWAWAGAAGALASGTRPVGIVLLLPLAAFYFYGPRGDMPGPGRDVMHRAAGTLGERLRPLHKLRLNALWIALVPAGMVAYSIYLRSKFGGLASFESAQSQWARHFDGPFSAVWVAADHVVRHLGTLPHVTVAQSHDYGNFLLLILLVIALAGVFRRLPVAYGLFTLGSLALPLSYPAQEEALLSLVRFSGVLFPVAIWLALVCEERRLTRPVAVGFGCLLLVAAALEAHGTWVA